MKRPANRIIEILANAEMHGTGVKLTDDEVTEIVRLAKTQHASTGRTEKSVADSRKARAIPPNRRETK